MSRQRSLYGQRALDQWTTEVTAAFPHLSKPQATGLAWWSFGMVLARSGSLPAVAWLLVKLLGLQFLTMRQRLREFYPEAAAKSGSNRGRKRQPLAVSTCFASWLRWVLKDWPHDQVAIARDASTLGQRFTVLCLSVVYRGSAVPVAWKIVTATSQGSWKEPWLGLLAQLHAVVPAGWTVVVLADRGLYAKWLFEGIRKLHWHPLFRINQQGKFRPQGWVHFVPLASLVPYVGGRWRGQGTAFATPEAQLDGTWLAFWGEGHEEAWLVLTDLAPESSDASWYGLRRWIEQFFKDGKRGGWQWQKTRLRDAARAERLWLAIAVATVWLVRVGGADEETSGDPVPDLEVLGAAERPRTPRWRLVSVFQRGWVTIVAALVNHTRLPLGHMVPEAGPTIPEWPQPAPAQADPRMAACKTYP